ncbi:MAG: pentapeptide repeat-containing protein [Xenococcus sp. MO_188.B8]|nr:pentapeptide repeat-containing protein [Xenococcus sp. MO_188.B8]
MKYVENLISEIRSYLKDIPWITVSLTVIFIYFLALISNNDVRNSYYKEGRISAKLTSNWDDFDWRLVSIFLDQLEAMAIASAAILYFKEAPARKEQKLYEAWQVIDNAYTSKVETSYARIKALEYLAKEGESLQGIDLYFESEADRVEINKQDKVDELQAEKRLYGEKPTGKGVDLQKINLENANLREADLRLAKFDRANLKNADLSKANVCGADFSVTNLSGTKFTDAKVLHASFGYGTAGYFNNKEISELVSRGAIFFKLKGLDLSHSTVYRNANLQENTFENVDLSSSDLSGANLSYAKFIEGTNLSRAKLINTILQNAKLNGVDLDGTDLRGSDLRGADLRDANLRDAKLNGVNLDGTDLRGSDLRGADLRDADLRDAKLNGVQITNADFSDALYSNKTTISNGDLNELNPMELGMKLLDS